MIQTQYPKLDKKFEDFRYVLSYVWERLGYVCTPVQLDIADFLQQDDPLKMIKAFRGVGKTWITGLYVVWVLRYHPTLNIKILSATQTHADAISKFCKALIRKIDIFHCMDVGTAKDDNTANDNWNIAGKKYDPDTNASVNSLGINSQITGGRADIIICDDIEIPTNSDTFTQRLKLLSRMIEYQSVIKPLPHAKIIVLGTPHSLQSIYNDEIFKNYHKRIWTARYPTLEKLKDYHGCLAPKILEQLEIKPSIAGMAVDHHRFNTKFLLEKEDNIGKSTFLMQFMLDTSLSDETKYPLKLNDLLVYALDNEECPEKFTWGSSPDLIIHENITVGFDKDNFHRPISVSDIHVPYQRRILVIDPAGAGVDETAYCVLYSNNGYIFLMEQGGFKGVGFSDAVLNHFAYLAKKHKVQETIIESNFGGGSYGALLTKEFIANDVRCNIEEIRNQTQKERRIIETIEPVMNSHRLVVNEKAIIDDYYSGVKAEHHRLMYQLSHMTASKGCLEFDDRIDVLALGISYLSKDLVIDVDQSVRDRQEEDREIEWESWLSHNGVYVQRTKEQLEIFGFTPHSSIQTSLDGQFISSMKNQSSGGSRYNIFNKNK